MLLSFTCLPDGDSFSGKGTVGFNHDSMVGVCIVSRLNLQAWLIPWSCIADQAHFSQMHQTGVLLIIHLGRVSAGPGVQHTPFSWHQIYRRGAAERSFYLLCLRA